MITVDLYLPRKVKDEILDPLLIFEILNLFDEPVKVSLKKFNTIDHASIWAKLELFHNVFKRDELMDVNGTLPGV
jgi:hypothetical protein